MLTAIDDAVRITSKVLNPGAWISEQVWQLMIWKVKSRAKRNQSVQSTTHGLMEHQPRKHARTRSRPPSPSAR